MVQSSLGFINGYDALGAASADNEYGGLVDLFVGWNFQISRAIVGAQIEVTASDLDFSPTGFKTTTSFNGAGPTGLV